MVRAGDVARLAAGLCVLAALGACAIPSSRSNAVVMTDNQAVVENCRRLGQIDGDGALGSAILMDRARDSAIARLKIRAAEMNGTHVHSEVANTGWKGGSTSGTVYSCTN